MFESLFRTKSTERILADAEAGEIHLKRTLTATQLTLLGIGCIIGAGIFVLSGHVAATHAGPAISLSFVISALACMFAGLCYAEFASMIPVSGSAYTYSYATLGEFLAWIIGWDLILEYLFAAASVAVGWSGYATSFLRDAGINIPARWTTSPFHFDASGGFSWTEGYGNWPAAAIILVITVMLIVGVRQTANLNALIVFIKVGVILLFIGFGAGYVNPENWTPFIPENTGDFGHFGWSGVLRGAGVVFFSYIGFDAVCTAAQEAKNPRRDLPKAIFLSLASVTLLYVAVSLVLTGLVPYKELGGAEPIATGIDAAGDGLRWLSPLLKLGAVAGLSSVILVMMLGQTRIFYSMAKDRLLPDAFTHLHPRFHTPVFSTLFTGGVAAVIALLFPIGLLGEMVSIGALLAFAMVCLAVLIMRKRRPNLERPFRTPWVPFVPLAGIVLSGVQMLSLSLDTWVRLIVWMALGIVVYFAYSRRRSLLNNPSV